MKRFEQTSRPTVAPRVARENMGITLGARGSPKF